MTKGLQCLHPGDIASSATDTALSGMRARARPRSRIRVAALAAARWCAALSLSAVPISKPATVVLLALALAGSLLGPGLAPRIRGALRDPVVLGSVLWWGVLAISAIHAGARGQWSGLADSGLWVFLYPLILASVLVEARWRWRALAMFAAAVALVLCLSYAMQFGWLPQRPLAEAAPTMRNTVFKDYTQQGLSTLILCSMAVSVAVSTRSLPMRIAAATVAVAAIAGVILLLQSRTAYIVTALLAIYWATRWSRAQRGRARWVVAIAGAALMACAVIAMSRSPLVEQRLLTSVQAELLSYQTRHEPTSAGIRLHLWRQTLPIVADAPWFGHGLGRWRPLYAERAAASAAPAPFLQAHPHQEFLLVLSEEGAVGLAILLCLILALWRRIGALPDPQRGLFASVVLIYLSAGLFNALWSDFTHRHMFVLLLACIPASEANSPDRRRQVAA